MRRHGAALGLFIAMFSSTAFAQEAAAPKAGAAPAAQDLAARSTEATCGYLRAVAESESSLLVSPQIFATGGAVSGSDSPTGGTTGTIQPRLIVGLQYGASSLYRGIQTKERAEAECRAYTLFNKLLAFTFVHGGAESAPALRARLDVLEAARPQANDILKRAREAVAEARITTDELDAATTRVDSLHAAISETRGKLRAAEGAMKAPDEPLQTLLDHRDVAERAAEDRAARIRQAQAWDVNIKAGYDQIFGQHQPVPIFAALTVTFNPGLFWQRPADDRAEVARAAAARTGLENASVRAEDTARRMRETARAERERLADVTTLLGELEARHQVVSQVQGDKAKASADSLWLAMVSIRAERAFLAAHIADIAKTLGDGGAR